MALEAKEIAVSALDLSSDALAVAKQNADRLEATVEFYQSDWLEVPAEKEERFHIVVSNPPYIPRNMASQLATHVREHEPKLALYGGKNGLHMYHKLVEQLPAVLADEALVAFEVGVGQAKAVEQLLHDRFPKAQTKIVIDLNGKERIVLAFGDMRS